jgi:hypothetical protein
VLEDAIEVSACLEDPMPSPSDDPTEAGDINDLAAQVKDLAAERGLAIVPAMPLAGNTGPVVLLDRDDMTAREFCDLAVTAGAPIIYVQSDPFDADGDLTVNRRDSFGWAEDGENAGLASLRQEASAYNGRTGELAIGFAAGGILHSWIATAPWYDRLAQRLQELQWQSNPRFEQLPEAEEQALITRVADELAALPEFRAAPSAAQRRRVALAQAGIAELQADTRPGYRSAALRGIYEAGERVAAEAEARYREMERDLAELAAECAATPSFRLAASARARRERARDFLIEKAGGFPPPARLLELFLDTPPLQNARTGRH